jgi:hypothetical protein
MVTGWTDFRRDVPRRIGGHSQLPMGRIPVMGLCRGDSFLEVKVDLLQAAPVSEARKRAASETRLSPLHSGKKRYAQMAARVAIGAKMKPTFIPRLA